MSEIEQEAEKLARYDLITNYRAGSSIEEMERADDGDWVRYEQVEPLLARLREVQIAGLNEATRLVDAERRRWYAALEQAGLTNLEGLAPEVVADKVRTLREALTDIAGADETSTLEGAVAIALQATKESK